MKKTYFLLIFPFLFLLPTASQAYVAKSNDFIYVAKDEIVEGNLYFVSKSLNIEGQVLGDVIGLSQNIQINGQVAGDVIVLSQNISVNGKIDGNFRALSDIVTINGEVNKNINFLGDSLTMGEKSIAKQDIALKAINLELNGQVKGNVHGGSNKSLIRGNIEKDLNLIVDSTKKKKYLNSLQIEESSKIGGLITYRGGNDALIKSDFDNQKITKKEPINKKKAPRKFNKLIFSMFSSFIIAIIIRKLFKKKLRDLRHLIIEKNYKLMLNGAMLLFLTPIAVILLLISIIGIPLALIIFIVWLFLIYLSKIIFAITLGYCLFKRMRLEKKSPYLKILTGVVVLYLILNIPFVGWILSLAITLMFLGAVYYIIKNKKYVN